MTKIGLLVAALTLMLGVAPEASATFIAASGTYHENLGSEAVADDLTLSNDALSEADITMIVIDLSGSANNAVFDPAGSPFTVIGVDVTGFDGNFTLNGNQELTLVFNDFQAGETFSFGVDVDDVSGQTNGGEFAGATFTATFSGVGPNLLATYLDAGGNDATAAASLNTPEPATLSSICLGLIAIAAARRARGRDQA